MTEYSKKTKSELITEIEQLRVQLAEFKSRDETIRNVRDQVEYDPNVPFTAEPAVLTKMLGSMNELVYYIEITPDQRRIVRYIGPQVKQILGVTMEQYVNELDNVISKCHPDDIPGIVETAKRLKDERKPKSFVYRFMHAEKKQYIWIEETVYPQYDETGRHSANIGVSRDITDRKEAELQVQDKEQSLSLILNNIGEVVYYAEYLPGGKRNVKFISERIEELMGMTTEEYRSNVGSMVSECHPDDQQHIRDTVEKIKTERKPQTFRYRFKHRKTGEYRWIEEQLFPRYDAQGRHFANFGVTRDVTNEKETLEALSKSEQALSMVLNNIGDVIYHVDFQPGGKKEVRFVSENIERVLGVSKAVYMNISDDLMQYAHPDDIQQINDSIQEVIRKRKPRTLFYRFRHAVTQEYQWVEERVFPSTSADGKMISLFGIVRNVDALQKALEALQQSENRLVQISESSPIGIFITDANGKPVYINKKVEDISGLPADKILQHAWFRRMQLPDSRRLMKKIRKAVKEKSEYADEFQFQRGENDTRWLRIKVSVIASPKNRFSGWVGTVEDITVSLESERLLRESEVRFRMLAENASDIIYRFAIYPEPRYEYVSPSVYAITGYTPEDFYSNPYLGFQIVHEEDTSMLKQSEEVIREKTHVRSVDDDQGLMIRWVKKDGQIIWTDTRNKPIFDEDGRVVAIEGISRDISRQKKNEEALRESEERFKLLSQAAMEGIVFVESGRIVDANEQFMSIFGYAKREELIGLTIDRIITPQQIGTRQEPKYRTELSTYEIKCRRKDGKEIFVEARGQDIPFGGKTVRILTINDITERKLAEDALRESERTLSTLMANLPGMAYRCLYDDKWTMLFVSEGCEELTGYNPDDLLGNKKLSFADIVLPIDRKVGRKEIEEAIATHTPFEIQYRIVSSQGKEKWVWEKGSGVFSPKGELLFIEGFIADVTQRKQYEIEVLASRESYRNLIEQSPDGVVIERLSGEVIFANQAALKIMGLKDFEQVRNQSSFQFAHPDDLDLVVERRRLVTEGHDLPFITVRGVRPDGEAVVLETKPILYEHMGHPAVLMFMRDITVQRQFENEQIRAQIAEETNKRLQAEIEERIRAERLLEANQKYVRLLIDSSLDMICASDNEGIVTEFNHAAQRTFGYKAWEVVGKHVSYLYEEPKQRIDVMNELITGSGVFSGEVTNKKKNGETFTAYLSANVLRNDKGEVIGAMGVSRDITEMKKAEQKLRDSEQKIRAQAAKMNAVFETSSHHIWTVDRKMRLTSYNHNQAEWLEKNYGIKAEIGLSMVKGKMISSEEFNNFWLQKLEQTFAGIRQQFETAFTDSEGDTTWREVYLNPIYDESGNAVEVSCIAHDITDKKRAEESLRLSLKEKEVLLKEVHHRVKNNLQVISSILNLQSSYVRDQKTLELLRESQNRIKSMAFIHESLYQTKDFSNINFSEYVQNISKNLVHSYSGPENPPELHIETDSIFLNLDTAIPCGLVINELLSNALKYAFPNGRQGNIYVKMKADKKAIQISIADDGVGLPDTVDYRNTESLGLQLVVTLVEQINGKIRLDNKKGTKFVIDFNYQTTNP